jgi:predicted DNA-binding protein with PD1-like motif
MKYKALGEQPKTYVLIFETGDELASGPKQFASEQKLQVSSFNAIGAFSSVKLGWFNWNTKKYEIAVELNEQLELLSLIGDIAEHDGQPEVHAHVVVGKSDGTAHGGHLLEAMVRPTCEVILTDLAVVSQAVSPDKNLDHLSRYSER